MKPVETTITVKTVEGLTVPKPAATASITIEPSGRIVATPTFFASSEDFKNGAQALRVKSQAVECGHVDDLTSSNQVGQIISLCVEKYNEIQEDRKKDQSGKA